MEDSDIIGHDMTTALRSEIAALQYKKDKLTSEVRITTEDFMFCLYLLNE